MRRVIKTSSFSLLCTLLMFGACAAEAEHEYLGDLSDNTPDSACEASTHLEGAWQYLGSQSLPQPDSYIETTAEVASGTNLILDLHVPFGEGELSPDGREKRHSYFVLASAEQPVTSKQGNVLWISTSDVPNFRSVYQTEDTCPAQSPGGLTGEGIDMYGQALPQSPTTPSAVQFGLGKTETKAQADGFRLALAYDSSADRIERVKLCIVSVTSDTRDLDSDLILERFSQTSCYADHKLSNPIWPWVTD